MKVVQPSRSPAAQGNLTPLKCSYCDQERHSVDRCYFLHGFPVGHKQHGKNVKPPNRRKSTAHNTQASPVESTQAPTTIPNEKPTFTTKEYTQLVALLCKCHSGATDHISHSVPSNPMTPSQNDFVELPDGGHAKITSDVATKRMIGLGKQHKGLYYITRQQNPHLVHHVNHHSSLWHQRLGHPSAAPLQALSKSIPETIILVLHGFIL
ncbi:unnamed protein product [Prunus armeniaca]